MKINIRKAQAKQKCDWLDEGLNYGLNIAIVALNQEFGFGTKRSRQFVDTVLRLVGEIKDGAKKFTVDYQQNLDYGFEKICQEAIKITENYNPNNKEE